jgi:hypothetical protein
VAQVQQAQQPVVAQLHVLQVQLVDWQREQMQG